MDFGSGIDKRSGGFYSNPGIASGNHGDFARQIDTVQDFSRFGLAGSGDEDGENPGARLRCGSEDIEGSVQKRAEYLCLPPLAPASGLPEI